MTNKYKVGDEVRYRRDGKTFQGVIAEVDNNCKLYPYTINDSYISESLESNLGCTSKDYIIGIEEDVNIVIPKGGCKTPLEKLDYVDKILEERGNTHGDFRVNFKHTADLWTAYLGHEVTSLDVPIMMNLFKASRVKTGNGYYKDNYDDMQGYTKLAQQIQEDDVS